MRMSANLINITVVQILCVSTMKARTSAPVSLALKVRLMMAETAEVSIITTEYLISVLVSLKRKRKLIL